LGKLFVDGNKFEEFAQGLIFPTHFVCGRKEEFGKIIKPWTFVIKGGRGFKPLHHLFSLKILCKKNNYILIIFSIKIY